MFISDESSMNKHRLLMNEIKRLNQIQLETDGVVNCLKYKVYQALNNGNKQHSKKNDVNDDKNTNYFLNDRIAVYTTIIGKYDHLHEPIVTPDNCDYYVVTDQEIPGNSAWKKIEFNYNESGFNLENNILKSRFVKMFPNLLFPDYRYSVYVDGTFQVMSDVTEFVNNLNKYGLTIHMHPSRHCVYQEIKSCIKLGKGNRNQLLTQMNEYKKAGMPRNYGLLENGVIVRGLQNDYCVEIMKMWWNEFYKGSNRDQISLPFVLWKMGIPISEIGILGPNMRKNLSLRKHSHIK